MPAVLNVTFYRDRQADWERKSTRKRSKEETEG